MGSNRRCLERALLSFPLAVPFIVASLRALSRTSSSPPPSLTQSAEASLYRLKGHRDVVTDLKFLASGRHLISSSKDTFLRVWDLDTQHCIDTM